MAVKAGSGLLPGNITAGENSFVFAESQAFTLSCHKSILSLLLRRERIHSSSGQMSFLYVGSAEAVHAWYLKMNLRIFVNPFVTRFTSSLWTKA